MERWFTPQERGVILFLVAVLVLGGTIYVYKVRNPYFAPELKLCDDKPKLMELIHETKATLKEPKIGQPLPREKLFRGPININKALKGELMSLTGIGAHYAQRIIDYREQHGGFNEIEELLQIKGIGKKKFEKLKDKITIK